MLELALRLWLLRGWTDPARGKQAYQPLTRSQGKACDCWRGSLTLACHPHSTDPPGQTVSFWVPSSERSSCFWAVTRKKCPGEVCWPSERLKWKPPSRAPEDGWSWVSLVHVDALSPGCPHLLAPTSV